MLAAHLGQQGDECRLAEQSALTGHVRSGDDDDLLCLCVEEDVVGDVAFAHGELLLDDGMAAAMYVDGIAVVHDGAYVSVLLGALSKGEEAVELCQERRIALDGCDVGREGCDELVEEHGLEAEDAFLGTHYLVLVLLEFLCDVSLGLRERLLAYPVRRHLVAVGVAHLEVVAEDVVVAYLQALYAGLLYFALLHFEQVALPLVGDVSQFVQFAVDAFHDDAAAGGEQWRVGPHFTGDAVAYVGTEVEPLSDVVERVIVGGETHLFDGLHGLQGDAELYNVARCDAPCADLRYDAFQVAHRTEPFQHGVAEVGVAEEVLHDVLTFHYLYGVLQGEEHPSVEHAGAHGGDGAVDDVEERDAAFVHAAHQFEVAHRELVEADVAVLLDATQRGDVSELLMLCHLQVLQDDTCRHHCARHVLYAEALQAGHLEVAQEFLSGGLLGEGPVVELEGDVACAERPFEHAFLAALVEHFLGGEGGHELVDVVGCAFRDEELAGADVEECHAAGLSAEVYGAEEVVLAMVEHRVGHGDAGRDEFRDATLDERLRHLRVFELVADGHTFACPDELRQVGVECVIGEAGHGDALDGARLAVVAPRQGDAQYLGCDDSIVGIRLVEVAATEQQKRLGVLGLEVVELFHHRCERFFCHVCLYFLSAKLQIKFEMTKETKQILTSHPLRRDKKLRALPK